MSGAADQAKNVLESAFNKTKEVLTNAAEQTKELANTALENVQKIIPGQAHPAATATNSNPSSEGVGGAEGVGAPPQ